MSTYRALALATVFGGLLGISGPVLAQSAGGLVYLQPVPPQTVQAVQQRLRQDGDYVGAVDGVWGADSQAALQRYQQRHDLQVTGQLNQATAAIMGLDTGALLAQQPVAPPPPAVSGEMLRPSAVQAIQYRLRRLGYYNGPVDGVWGPGTEAALRGFQQGSGLQIDGSPGPSTVAALGLAPDVISLR